MLKYIFMEILDATVNHVEQKTHDVLSFFFDLKGKQFSYLPGQFLQLILDIKDCDARCNIRSFSIASSPTETEKTNQLMITTKFSQPESSSFKKALSNLKTGDAVKIRGPFGRFLLQSDYLKPAVMLAGGIGITPFRNMIVYASDQKLSLPITLISSNKTQKDIVWKDDFDKIATQNSNFKPVYTITDEKPADGNFETSRINKQMINKYVKDVNNTIFYICGPAGLVDSMITVLKELNVSEENINFEKFTGY